MFLLATFPKKVRVRCEVCEKEYLLDKVWYNNNGYNCCEPLTKRQKTTKELVKQLKQDEILEFNYVDDILIPIVQPEVVPATFEIDFKEEIKPGPRKKGRPQNR